MTSQSIQLNFVQHNFNRQLHVHYSLAKSLETSTRNTIVLAQEVHVNKDKGPTGILGFRTVCHSSVDMSRPDPRIKAAVYISERKKFSALMLAQFCSENVVTVRVTFGSRDKRKELTIINAYVEPEPGGGEALRLVEHALACLKGDSIILAGDLNGRHTSWNDREINKRGETVDEITVSNELTLINQGSELTYMCKSGSSIIDLTFASFGIADHISRWRVSDMPTTSDHKVIEFTLANVLERDRPGIGLTTTYKYKVTGSKWPAFMATAAERLSELMEMDMENREQVNLIVGKLEEVTDEICSGLFPKLPGPRKRVKWWTDEISLAKNEAMKLKHKVSRLKRNNACSNVIDRVYTAHSQKKEIYVSAMQKASRECFQKMVAETDERDAFSLSSQIIKHKRKQYDNTTMKFGNDFTRSERETAERALRHFFPDDNSGVGVEEVSSGEEEVLDLPFTKAELLQAAKKFPAAKSPGADGMTADICRHAIEACPSFFLKLFNSCLEIGYFPRLWKIAVCKLIPKAGKDDYQKIESWRPIGLLSLLGKTFESLIIERVKYHLYKNEHLSPHQFGFTEQKSTVDALIDYVRLVESFKSRGQVALCSLDIKGAFDNVKWTTVHKQLKKYSVPVNLRRIIASYLSEREVGIKTSVGWISKETNQGAVQGSVSGPTLWNIVLNSIFELDLGEGLYLRAFADDLVLIGVAATAASLISKINSALEKIAKWGQDNGLEFAPAKTQYLPFTRAVRISAGKPVMNNTELTLCDEVKILGVTIDRMLRFNTHVANVIEKANRVYRSICVIARKLFGASGEVLRTIYLRAIRPIVMYAAPLWSVALKWKKTLSKLKSFERRYMKLIARSYNSVSTEALWMITDVKPIHLEAKELTSVYTFRKKGKLEITERKKHLMYDRGLKRAGSWQLEPLLTTWQLGHPALREGLKFTELTSQEEVEEVIGPEEIVYFTDGRVALCGVAAGWIEARERGLRLIDQRSFKLVAMASAFQAGMAAVHDAIDHIKSTKERCKVHLCCDNKQVLSVIASRTTRNRLANSIKESLTWLKSIEVNVLLYWTPTLEAEPIKGNVKADYLTRKTVRNRSIEPTFNWVTRRIVRVFCAKVSDEQWNNEYLSSKNASVTKKYLPDTRIASIFRKATQFNFFLTQALTGHGSVKSYLKKRKIIDDDSCSCGQEQSSTHLLEECPRFDEIRGRYQVLAGRAANEEERSSLWARFATDVMIRVNLANRRLQPMNQINSSPTAHPLVAN